jgi:WD40 repeat protein
MCVGYGESAYRMPLRTDDSSPDVVRLGPPRKLPLPQGRFTATRDGKFLGSGWDNRATILRRDGSDRLFTLTSPGTRGQFWCVAITSDGRWVVSGGTAVTVWRREGDTYVKARELLTGRNMVRVMISPDDRWLATVERSTNVSQIWRVGTWEAEHPPGEGGFGGAFSPDGKYFAIGAARGDVRLLEAATGRELARMEEYLQDRPGYIEYSPDGTKLIVVSGIGRRVHVWDLRLISQQLAEIGLGWELPAFPESASSPTPVRRLELDWGDLDVHKLLKR